MIIRQGDVPLTIAPVNGKLTPKARVNGRAVLAFGERTGHHHSTADSHADVLFDEQGREVFIVSEGAVAVLTPVSAEKLEIPVFDADPIVVHRVHTADGTVVRVDESRFTEAEQAIKNAATLSWPGALVTHQEHDAILLPPTMPGFAYTNPGQRSYVSADMPVIRVDD